MENRNQNASAASSAESGANLNTDTNINKNANANTASVTSAGGTSAGDSFDELMQQSPRLCPLSGWLKCLRKPALSLQYSLQKRHIPDLDAEAGRGAASGQKSPSGGGDSASAKGQNSDTMDVTGGFTIRYLDLALGVMGLTLLWCVWKGHCCLKRLMK